eukprot:4353156-Karenia_brevis.AAC.1
MLGKVGYSMSSHGLLVLILRNLFACSTSGLRPHRKRRVQNCVVAVMEGQRSSHMTDSRGDRRICLDPALPLDR